MYHRPISNHHRTVAKTQYGFRARDWADQDLSTIFKAYREAYGKSIEDVAQDLCIRRSHIRALESDTYGDLPEQSYAAGFVRSYAKYLGLPAEDMTRRFRESYHDHAQMHAAPRIESLQRVATVAYSPRWPSFAVLVIAALLLGTSYMVMTAYTAVTNPDLSGTPPQRAETDLSGSHLTPIVADPEDDILIQFEIEDSALTPKDEPSSDAIDIVFDGLVNETVDLHAHEGQTLIYGVSAPRPRPALTRATPLSLEPINRNHRVIIEATGLAHLILYNHHTGEPFLRTQYQRGDAYPVPYGQIVSLMSLDMDKIRLVIDGVAYRVAPATAALNERLVLDPDTILGSNQLIAME